MALPVPRGARALSRARLSFMLTMASHRNLTSASSLGNATVLVIFRNCAWPNATYRKLILLAGAAVGAGRGSGIIPACDAEC